MTTRLCHWPFLLIIMLIVIFVALSSIVAFYNIPYYNSIDEGHVLLWVDLAFTGDVPLRIFYGPVIFYCILVTEVFLSPFFLDNVQPSLASEGGRAALFYNHYRSEVLMYAGRLNSIIFLVISLVLAYALSLKKTQNAVLSIAIVACFALQPFLFKFSATIQPEIISVALLLALVLTTDRLLSRGAITLINASAIAIILSLLAATKLHYIAFSMFPVLAVFGCFGLREAFKASIMIGSLVVVLTLALYLPLRSPAEIIDLIEYASQYYDNKSLSVPFGQAVLLRTLSFWQALVLIAFTLWVLRFRASPIAIAFLITSIFILAYFSTKPFANMTNLVFLNVLVLVLVLDMLSVDYRRMLPDKLRGFKLTGIFISFLLVVILASSYPYAKWVIERTSYVENRTVPVVTEIFSSDQAVFVDRRLQMYPDSSWVDATYLPETVPGGDVKPAVPGRYIVAERYPSLEECALLHEVDGQAAGKVNFFLKNAVQVFIFQCP